MNGADRTAKGGLRLDDVKPCAVCGEGILHGGVPVFFRAVGLEYHVANAQAIQQHAGLEQMLGEAAPLARILSPIDTISAVASRQVDLLVCLDCPTRTTVAELAEEVANRET